MNSWDCLHLLAESLGQGKVTERNEHDNETTSFI